MSLPLTCCTVEVYRIQMGQIGKRTSIFRRKHVVFVILEIHFSKKGQCSIFKDVLKIIFGDNFRCSYLLSV